MVVRTEKLEKVMEVNEEECKVKEEVVEVEEKLLEGEENFKVEEIVADKEETM